MIEDAKAGKIDYIITKSISRFARNTVDTLNCVRELQKLTPAVGCWFEKENIDTLDTTGELILTILSALAQDESRSISDNIRWSIQKKFESGDPMVDLNRMLGYDKGENGEWIINESQAAVVRYIYAEYLRGVSATQIAKALNESGISTARGNIWRADAVLLILRNEKYVGDLVMQKTVTESFLTHKKLRNKGIAPKYYVKDHHVGIISREDYDRVQLSFQKRAEKREENKKRGLKKHPCFHGICYVGEDGQKHPLVRTTYTSTANNYTDERSMAAQGVDDTNLSERYFFNYPLWKADGVKLPGLNRTYVLEVALEESFMEMLYQLKREYEEKGEECDLCRAFALLLEKMANADKATGEAQRKAALEEQIRKAEENLHKARNKQLELLTREDGSGEEMTGVYDALVRDIEKRLDALLEEREELEKRTNTYSLRQSFDLFLKCLQQLPSTNAAGMPIKVNGLDTDGSIYCHSDGTPILGRAAAINRGQYRITQERIENTPDFLIFDRTLFDTFITGATVKSDVVEYDTVFGLKLTTKGNSRVHHNFFGFRTCKADGRLEILDTNWKVNSIYGRKISYSRNEVKWKRPDRVEEGRARRQAIEEGTIND